MGLQKKIRVDTSIKKKNAKLNIKYAILQMMFWTCAASAYAYLTQMLQYKGFTDGQIGVINAVKLFSTVVFQIIIGVFSDRHAERIQLKYIISVLTAVALLLTFVFYEYKLSFVQTVMLFIGFGATFTCISPLIDSLSIKYMNGGKNINYPICRAAGSCAWAVACVLFGVFCDRYDANRLLILQMLLQGFGRKRENICSKHHGDQENRGTHRRISAHNIPEVQVVSHRFSGYVHGI